MTHKLQGLYAITDASLISDKKFSATIEQALSGGVSIIQYRDKTDNTLKRLRQAGEVKLLCEQYNTTFIINDDIELATETDADGVHLGANDHSYEIARDKLGSHKIIGITCYNQINRALHAQKMGADYVAFGSFYTSSVKPMAVIASLDLLQQAKQQLTIPVCAIGGINLNNASQLITEGADMLAVITGVFGADDIQYACSQFSALFIE